MRIVSKYKFLRQLKFLNKLVKFPLKLQKSKRTYLKLLQQQYLQYIKRQKKIKNINLSNGQLVKKNIRRWSFLNNHYREGLSLKRQYYYNFDLGVRHKFLKIYFKKQNFIKFDLVNAIAYFLIKPYYKLDILLSSLFFYNSVYEARQAIVSKKIVINNEYKSINYYVKKGDIISICDDNFFVTKKLYDKQNFLLNKFFSFLEYDNYTKTIIIVNNINELNFNDYNFLIQKNFNLQQFITYLKYDN